MGNSKEFLSMGGYLHYLDKYEKKNLKVLDRSICDNCHKLFRGGYPQIDGETFKLCHECFNVLRGVVRDIENIFDG